MSHPLQLLAVTGKQCAGKDTFFEIYKRALANIDHALNVVNLKFTDPLYAMQNVIYKLARLEPPKVKDRALLQYLGTDWGRAKDPEIWIRVMKQKIREGYAAGDFMVITDLRFSNEADHILVMGGKIVKIEASHKMRRARASSLGIDFIEEHPSEMQIDKIEPDFSLPNDGSLGDFADAVGDFIERRFIN